MCSFKRLTGLFTTLIALIFVQTVFAQEADRPNVIVMVADDLGWNDVGYHGGNIDTPSLDKLAEQGVQLNRFYTTPICSPTRAALMTGRDPMRLGIAYGVILPWDNIGVNPAEHFMPQSFQAAGYQTAMVGKWHLGHAQMTYHPNQRGFEHFYGHLHTEVGFYPPFANVGGKDFQENGVSIDDEGYETYLLADEVSRYIRDRDDESLSLFTCPSSRRTRPWMRLRSCKINTKTLRQSWHRRDQSDGLNPSYGEVNDAGECTAYVCGGGRCHGSGDRAGARYAR